MNSLNNSEMQSVYGGAIKWSVIAGVGGIASFIIGVIDGWMHPKKCN